jgi:hypothetical protein
MSWVQSPFVLHAIAAYERAFKLMETTLASAGRGSSESSPPRRHQHDAVVTRLAYLGPLGA